MVFLTVSRETHLFPVRKVPASNFGSETGFAGWC